MTLEDLKPTRQEMNRRQAIADSIAIDAVFDESTREALQDIISTFGHRMTEQDQARLSAFAGEIGRYSRMINKGV